MKAGSFPFVANFQSFGEKPKIHTTTAAAVIDSKSLYNRIYALFSFVPPSIFEELRNRRDDYNKNLTVDTLMVFSFHFTLV